MLDTPRIVVLPIGEFVTVAVRAEFDARLAALQATGAEVVRLAPVADDEGIERFAEAVSASPPDLLVMIALRGLSAPVMEAAARLCDAPCLLWPIPGRFALPSSALAAGALRGAGRPVELLYAPANNPTALTRLQHVIRAARAYTRLRRSRIGILGGLFPNLVACRYDPATVSARLGVTLLPLSFEEIRRRQAAVPASLETADAFGRPILTAYPVQPAEAAALGAGLRLHQALKQAAHEQALDGFALECWTGCPRELGLNPCLGFIEDAYTIACEGDVLLCVALLIVRYLTGRSAYTGDIYDLDLDGNLTLVHCGGPAALAADSRDVVVGPSQAARERGFETVTCRPRLAAGPVTLLRFYGADCDRLHLALGELSSSEQSPNLTVRLCLAGDRWDFLQHCLGNHYSVVAGDIRDELKLLCGWLVITVFET